MHYIVICVNDKYIKNYIYIIETVLYFVVVFVWNLYFKLSHTDYDSYYFR